MRSRGARSGRLRAFPALRTIGAMRRYAVIVALVAGACAPRTGPTDPFEA